MAPEAGTALVTGASSGFGRLIALALASRGYQVAAAFRGTRFGFEQSASDLAAASGAMGGDIRSVRMDVCDDGSVSDAVRETQQQLGHIDVLLNCAGYGLLGPFESTTIQQIRQLYETNVFGTMRVTHAVLPGMRERGSGLVLNFGSDVGVRANFFQTAYASSKFAIEGFTQALRLEVQHLGIRVAVISPGWYETEFGLAAESTFGIGASAGAYQSLVSARNEGVEAAEGPNSQPQEVADMVVGVVDEPLPDYRYAIGWNPVRMAGVTPDAFDRYEERLFEYYGLERFAAGQAASGRR
jgi:NAD(P)-dependent dehydrogenase (short-subunit alcohol dehydrogenase family)